MQKTSVLAGLFAAILASTASAAGFPVQVHGDILTGSNGMTLYTFDRDFAGSGKSLCNGSCTANWPPLTAEDGDSRPDANYTVITRDDGSKQWAFKGKPLYFWAGDQKPGDRNGDGFNGVWHSAKP